MADKQDDNISTLTENKGWMHSWTSNNTNYCYVCLEETTKVCSNCENVYYCSKGCQNGDWSRHKGECVKKFGLDVVDKLIPRNTLRGTNPSLCGEGVCTFCGKFFGIAEGAYQIKYCSQKCSRDHDKHINKMLSCNEK